MADLLIDVVSLERLRTNLDRIEDLLSGPCRGMAELPVEAAGHQVLRDRLRDFADEWDHGIGKLGEFSQAAVEALRNIVDTFQDLEAELAAALDPEER